jgi:hypothetical protein
MEEGEEWKLAHDLERANLGGKPFSLYCILF